MKRRFPHFLLTHRKRGFTLIEVIIGGAIAMVVMGSVTSLFYLSALTINDTLPRNLKGGIERKVMDSVKYRLMHARAGSQEILDDGARIEFNDPNRGANVISSFWFEDGILNYDDDLSDSTDGMVIARGVDGITFEHADSSAIVSLTVVLMVPLSKGKIERREGRSYVYLRNGGAA